MALQRKLFLQQFFRVAIALLITLFLIRVYEYAVIASKSFTEHAYQYELAGLFYDLWLWLIWCTILFFPSILIARISNRTGIFFFQFFNIILLLCYIALLITFSERNTPFDHELFTRNSKDTTDTIKQMLTAGLKPYIPYIVYLPVYFLLQLVTRKITPSRRFIGISAILGGLAVIGIAYANPSPDGFKQNNAYYLVCNKLSFWINDSYHFFKEKREAHPVTDASLAKEIAFYQQSQPFDFVSTEYPMLHANTEKDVLGNFFNLQKTPPNIVIMVIEGLSRDFSGNNAFAGSFTPFLDSLSNQSLTWDNFLSTAPGTFAAHPAISGSLPYGKRGFSIMNVMPDHLSLIKIARANGYHTKFLVGFNPDFDNMGGYIRAQGTDFVLWRYPSKYKEMGVGKEGWSMGYPDDALYSRSFEIMDSLKSQPYMNIFHTGTTHLPYLFEQKPQYEKLFDQKIKTMNVSSEVKQTLKQTKEVLVTFMFSDDCLRKFFSDYAKRPEFNNTVFFITGDHHIGSFPATGELDDYHVPFIIYSPMLKKPQRFLSVNTHNNIAPTISAFLADNFNLPYKPENVHWYQGVLDTAVGFRNRQSMAFMQWSRDIDDYIWKDYFLSGDQLYKLTSNISQVKIVNDSVKNHIKHLRENFKIINDYVCDSNKVYPTQQEKLPGKKELLLDYSDTALRNIFTHVSDSSLMPWFSIPKGYKYLFVQLTGAVNIQGTNTDDYPTVRFAIIDIKGPQMFLYWSKRDLATLSKQEFVPKQWNDIFMEDMFTLSDYTNIKGLSFDLALYNSPSPIDLKIRSMRVRIYGIK